MKAAKEVMAGGSRRVRFDVAHVRRDFPILSRSVQAVELVDLAHEGGALVSWQV